MKKQILQLPKHLIQGFTYVDCGARGEASNPILEAFPDPHYIGFEPDEEECKALSKQAGQGISFFPVAAGRQADSADLYVTRNPSCSSLYVPNRPFFDSFMECGPFFDIVSTQRIQVVALDEYFGKQGVSDIDFLELDTQGAELDILSGAEKYIQGTLGVKVEVEFAEMYNNQPMFADVDIWLRQHRFMLFDLYRYHLRRNSCPPGIQSREQIIWGQALYLRDFHTLGGTPDIKKQKLGKLAVLASHYGFHSYAFEIIGHLMQDAQLLTADEKAELENASARYAAALQNSRIVHWMQRVDRSRFRKTFHRWGGLCTKLQQAFLYVTDRQKYFWKD